MRLSDGTSMANLLKSTDLPFTAQDIKGVRVTDSDSAYDIIYLLFHYNKEGDIVFVQVEFYNGKSIRAPERYQDHLAAIRLARAGDASVLKSKHYRDAAERGATRMIPVSRLKKEGMTAMSIAHCGRKFIRRRYHRRIIQ